MGGDEPHYEFMGPPGAAGIIVALPFTTYLLYYLCPNADFCVEFSLANILSTPAPDFSSTVFFSWEVLAVSVSWMIWLAFLYVFVPGRMAQGVKLADGSRLSYKINGFSSTIISFVWIIFLCSAGVLKPTYIHDHFLEFITAGNVVALVGSVLLFAVSTQNRTTNLSEGGNSGNLIYDFFIGRQLNPRTGDFDWKYFCELRPGLVGWVLINWSLAAAQYAKLGYITNSMVLVNVFELWYVLDALYNEEAILTTMDIVNDGFGFMLCFGDLAWVPFTYSLQARYLVSYPHDMSIAHFALVLTVCGLGYWIFRGANGQKNTFRTNPSDPSVAHLQTLKTERGTQLLITGWWGRARHINYFGDWLMGVAWCLPVGFTHVVPYFYAIYFAILLMHRERRDDAHCRQKYGKDWDKYCALVPYRIVPYVY